ncbi:barstar family protein [Undibacterium sp.]|uniref:barstar family protein n=1 Tax=Undibacterium sp. TaxID=1914977 RepID=UPI0027306AF2|nr:barstar family protein [Undibacterium sp.]MDP1978954.1 barstar family protein [Undibacterium sp.]
MTHYKNFCLASWEFLSEDEDVKHIELVSFSTIQVLRREVRFPSSQDETLQLSGCVIVDPDFQKSITSAAFSTRMTGLVIYMLDSDGRKIAEYNVTATGILNANVQSDGVMDIVLAVTHFDPDLEHVNVLQAMWCRDKQTKNRWADLDFLQRRSWLNLVRKHHCLCETDIEDKPANMVYELDGNYVTDYSSFLIALGEAINGPGGYFGGCFYALADCLCGGFGAETPFTLIWKASNIARIALDKKARIKEVLAQREYALRNHDYEEDELSSIAEIMARDDRPLFDEIIDFLQSEKYIRLLLEN